MANKVKFGLKNVHYAKRTVTSGAVTFGTPVAWPGAVSLSLEATGESVDFSADDIVYYHSDANTGYEGTYESALIPDSFRTDILKDTLGTDGVMTENSAVEPEEFALLFEFAGDSKATKHVIYRCKASRPGITGSTVDGSKTPQTETLNITAMPDFGTNGRVRAKTTDTTSDTILNGWYTSVFEG